MSNADISPQAFEALQGQLFSLSCQGHGCVQAQLLEVATQRAAPRPAFTLLFEGPAEPLLPQGLYQVRPVEQRLQQGQTWDIFVVPVQSRGQAVRYEAVFN